MKYLIAIPLLIVSIQSFGQFTRGDMALGGTLQLNAADGPTRNDIFVRNRSYRFAPRFGVFITPSFELGTQITLSSFELLSWSATLNSRYKSRSSALGIYAQKYFSIAEKFMITVAGSLSYSAGNNSTAIADGTTTTITEFKQRGVTVAIGPTLTFLPSDHWGLQLNFGSLGYSFEKTSGNNGNQSNFNLSYGAGYGLGIVYYFRRAKVESNDQ
jgi:hypothetical protein